MAWYYGTHTCGHEGEINVIGPGKHREWKIDAHFGRLCPDCRRRQEQEYAERLNKEWELPGLEGSEKQVAWANSIRAKKAKLMQNELETTDDRISIEWDYKNIKTTDDINSCFEYILINKTDARYWIDRRNMPYTEMLEEVTKDALYSDSESELELEAKEEKKQQEREYTVLPNNRVTDAVAVISFDDNYVEVEFERNSDFREIVKGLGYSWNGESWEKEIKETTGTVKERVAEVGNSLLNNGFPVSIMDENVRNMAIKGNFEPECRRWIYIRPKTRSLAIHWSGYSDDLYLESRTLPGAKWIDGGMVVDIAHYKEVQDFAEFNGFKFTKAAKLAIKEHIDELKSIDSVEVAALKTKNMMVSGLSELLDSSTNVLDDLRDD